MGIISSIVQRNNLTSSVTLCFCKSGGLISCDFLCDGKVDCPNGNSDEEMCYCNRDDINTNIYCKTNSEKHLDKLTCSDLYFMTKKGICNKFNGVNANEVQPTPHRSDIWNTISNDGQVQNNGSQNIKDDLVADSLQAEDEKLLISVLLFVNYFKCISPMELSCFEGHTKCYNITDICLYKLNIFKHLVPCRNGAHIQNCKTFECNMMFKCLDSYCIPWKYVCDGSWDCPLGSDEKKNAVCGDISRCDHMYKCKASHICIHIGNVCDKQIDCPYEDDEQFCDIKDYTCPSGCYCILFAVTCQNVFISKSIISKLSYTQSFVIHHSIVLSMEILIDSIRNISFLSLPLNNISNICGLFQIGNSLVVLDLGFNRLKELKQYCFSDMYYIKFISISNNQLKKIHSHSFSNLSRLTFINVSGNSINELSKNIFQKLPFFKLLDFSFQFLTKFHFRSFNDVPIKIILTKDYYVCCLVSSSHVCTSPLIWYLSCSDILPHLNVKITYSSVAMLTGILNILCLILHSFTKERKKPFSVIISFLNLTDLLCTFYLSIIWISDLSLKGKYFVKDKWWRSSNGCYTAFFAVIWLNILSQLILISLAMSRLMVVFYPLDSRFKRRNFVLQLCGSLCLLTFVFSGIIFSIFITIDEMLPSSLCLPFINPTGSGIMSRITTWFIAITQTITSLFVTLLHILLFVQIKASHETVSKLKTRESSSKPVLIQLMLISSSNILCWFPTNGSYVAAMLMVRYPTNLIIWVTVITLPINSILNPFIFCTVLIKKLLQF